jgi:hypothetical protein
MGRPTLAVSMRETSQNAKLSPVERIPGGPNSWRGYQLRARPPFVSSTYVSIDKTCPTTCPFKGNGCMAETGFTRVLGQRLDLGAIGMSGLEVAQQEAAEIDAAFGGGPVPTNGAGGPRDLRLHVGGDVANTEAARVLAEAAWRWVQRGGGSVWTFTHRWRTIPREAFGCISVLASVESVRDAVIARARGYAPALVVPEFPADHRAWNVGADLKAIPCPAESTGKVTCAQCRLCLDRPLHKMGVAIAFAVHGRDASKAAEALTA